MCGISGLITNLSLTADTLQLSVERMNQSLIHRGPDSGDLWLDAEVGIGLGHRRLAIVDLSPAGSQPMLSQDGRWVICYNGETYNQNELKPILEVKGITFKGHSDTELMVEACAVLGLEKALEHFIGMFAFALWDRHQRVLYLVRDRLGIKPLYWTYQNQTLFFASELKALKTQPVVETMLNRQALVGYLEKGYIEAPNTIYQNIYKLPAGHILTFSQGDSPAIKPYWSLKSVIQTGRQHAQPLSPEQAIEEGHTLLKDVISRRMIADVPLGAFLSGGIDSSLVVAVMQAQSFQPIKTFTVGFTEKDYNEAEYARKIAQHLNTDHTEFYVTPRQAQEVIPLLATMYDEPFADVSQIPTFLISKLARQHVTVALSGDGGDEVFGGYNRYAFGEKLWRYKQYLPGMNLLGGLLAKVPPLRWQQIEHFLPGKYRHLHLADRGEKIARLLQANSQQAIYQVLTTQWFSVDTLLPDVQGHSNAWPEDDFLLAFIDKMRYADTNSYLGDDVLVKVDRATMAVGLEARVPLLDHRLVSWAWQQPYTVYQGQTKWLLKQILNQYIPANLFQRPKKGFSVPIGDWLQGDLKTWASDLLTESSLKQTFNSQPILEAWQQHQKRNLSHSQQLWNILMFQAWRQI
jgi:asparagine synthase (glutamine-hydrolysing)